LPLLFVVVNSAAKAPFLARFKVAKCGTAVVEEVNTSEDSSKEIEFRGRGRQEGRVFLTPLPPLSLE